jgi:23S rRNA pseudouridine2605 synthase
VVKVKGVVGDEALARWRESIVIEGRATRPAEVRRIRQEGDKSWLQVVIKEGRNRQVRRLGEAAGFQVMRLARVNYAGISVEGLRPGQWRHLTVDELKELKRRFGVPVRVRPPTAQSSPPPGRRRRQR